MKLLLVIAFLCMTTVASAATPKDRDEAVQAVKRGQELVMQSRRDEALDAFREALDLYPAYPLAHHEIGVLLAEQGDLAGAEANLRKALELAAIPGPDGVVKPFGRAEQALAEVLRRQKRFDEALPHFASALRTNPKDTAAWYGLAATLNAKQQPSEALWAIQRMLEVVASPDSPLAVEGRDAVAKAKDAGVDAKAWGPLSGTALAKGAENLDGLGPDGLPQHEGDADFRRRAYVAAAAAYKKQAETEAGKKDPVLAYKLGATYAIMNETRLAIFWWRKSLALDPSREIVARHLALLVAKQRASDLAKGGTASEDAIARARLALQAGDAATALWLVRGSSSPDAAAIEGEARLQLGDWAGARAIYEEMLGADAEDHLAKGGLAEALLRGPPPSPTSGEAGKGDKAMAAWLGDDEARVDTFLVLRKQEVQARVLAPEPMEEE